MLFNKRKKSMQFSNNLIMIIVKILSAEEVKFNEIKALDAFERILLFIYLNKRNLISDVNFNHICYFVESPELIHQLIQNCPRLSNCNESGLTETILNRLIRQCFDEWFSRKNFAISNGKFVYLTRDLSNREINKMFWMEILDAQGQKEGSSFVLANSLFSQILNNIQINKKIPKRKIKKKLRKPSVKKPKYMNIFLKKKLKETILEKICFNRCFIQSFKKFKMQIISQYNSVTPFRPSIESEKSNPFQFQLKDLIVKALTQIITWFSKNGYKFNNLTAKSLKIYLRQVACPVTLHDQLRVFEIIEQYIYSQKA